MILGKILTEKLLWTNMCIRSCGIIQSAEFSVLYIHLIPKKCQL